MDWSEREPTRRGPSTNTGGGPSQLLLVHAPNVAPGGPKTTADMIFLDDEPEREGV